LFFRQAISSWALPDQPAADHRVLHAGGVDVG
jgi:hypothetical protein